MDFPKLSSLQPREPAKRRRILVGLLCAAVLAFGLPWALLIDRYSSSELVGIPLGYVLCVLILPLLLFMVMAFVARKLEDAERRMHSSERGYNPNS